MIADTYYGRKAAIYDAARKDSEVWEREHEAVSDLIGCGPVLDCPVGTGRFLGLYRSRGIECVGVDISGDMLAIARQYEYGRMEQGSVFELEGRYGTAVCIRLLHLLEPPDVIRAMERLTSVADYVVFGIRTGKQGKAKGWHTYTHSEDLLLDSLNGFMITDRHFIDETSAGTYIIYKAKRPTRHDVERQFSDRPAGTIAKLMDEWGARMGVKARDYNDVRCEYWDGSKIGAVLDECAARDPAMYRERPPRRFDQPMTCWVSEGKHGLIDGRHRANKMRHMEGRFPVLVIR